MEDIQAPQEVASHSTWQRFKHWLETHERQVSSGFLLGGFILDNLTLRRIDQAFDLTLLGAYIIIAAFLIIVLTVSEGKHEHPRYHTLALISLQWVLGGLFSASFIFYWRSGVFSASWPFVLALLAMLIGNEVVKERYAKLVFRATAFAFVLLSFVTLVLPVFVRAIGPWVFLLGVIICIGLMYLCLRVIARLAPEVTAPARTRVIAFTLGLYALVALLYFTNIIPPVPLALKDIAVAHSIERTDTGYILQVEHEAWYRFLSRPVYHAQPGEGASVYSAVFAPTGLSVDIVHDWQHKTDDGWQSQSRVSFPIQGGGDGGYRGYSHKSVLAPGLWRVNVETPRGQLIGRLTFHVTSEGVPKLEQVKR